MKKFFIPGFKLSGVACGLKSNKKARDLVLIAADEICSGAGVFTTNQVKAAPVVYSQKIIKSGKARAIVANSGGANAFTGLPGEKDVREIVGFAAKLLKIPSNLVLNASTGKIGPRLAVEKIKFGLNKAFAGLSPLGWNEAAQAIMTTDTRPKISFQEVKLSSGKIKIGGMAKGSGMINPNLATMLVFILTDLKASPEILAALLKSAANRSFNQLTVDNCMSTNDTVFLLASGKDQKQALAKGSADYKKFQAALLALCQDLSRQIAADGEGATKVIEVEARNVRDEASAKILAKGVAGSDLLKAAVFGADPNWGRILAAAGAAGVNFDPNRVEIFLGKTKVVSGGGGLKFDYQTVKKYLSGKNVKITLDLRDGLYSAVAFGCDLSYDYIKINAEYN